MDDLITRLRAAIDEDEAWAQAVEGTGEWDVPSTGVIQLGGIPDMDGLALATREAAYHIARHDPASVLRMVAAHRKILDIHELASADDKGPFDYGCTECHSDRDYGLCGEGVCDTVKMLAEGYGIEA